MDGSNKPNVPINKGNYSMDTPERDAKFEQNRGFGWEKEYKKYRDDWTNLPKNQIVSDYPLSIDLELSSICNLKCPMCYTITDEFKKKVNATRMDFDLYRKVIDEIAHKVPAVRLSFRGEATLHKNFVECIKYAKDNGIKEVSTLTHGFKLNLDFFKKISDAGIDWITVSIDGTKKSYEEIRHPLKFDELVKKLTDIKDYKEKFNLKRPVIKVQGIWPAVAKDPDEYYKIFAPIVDLVAFNPLIDYLFNDMNIKYVENFTCPQQYQRLVIGADGVVMKCSNDEENLEIIGNANNETVHEIWHGKEMQKVRDIHKNNDFKCSEVCKRCYIPRLTEKEYAYVDGRQIVIENYLLRSQKIGT